MSGTSSVQPMVEGSAPKRTVKLKQLMGSGDRIMLFTLAFVAIGLVLNRSYPTWFGIGELSPAGAAAAWAVLAVGVVMWMWSVVLILTKVPKGELITSGPFAVVKHPLYTAVALLVIPAVGVLLGSWLGVVIGAAMYAGSRLFAPAEERALAETFGGEWDDYCERVWVPWL